MECYSQVFRRAGLTRDPLYLMLTQLANEFPRQLLLASDLALERKARRAFGVARFVFPAVK